VPMSNLSRILTFALVGLLGGCQTKLASRRSPEADSRAIKLAVLAFMIKHYGDPFHLGDQVHPPKLVWYVNLEPGEIPQLKRLCGRRSQIAPRSEAMRGGGSLTNRDSISGGVLLTARVISLNGSEAQAFGVYWGPQIWLDLGYTLREGKGAWHVTSVNYNVPS